MKTIPSALLSLTLLLPVPALALDTDALLGGGLGGAVGALIGSEIGGRNGAIIGGAIGGAGGAALTTRRREPRVRREVVYVDRPVYVERRPTVRYVPIRRDNGWHRGHYKGKGKYRYAYRDDD